MTASLTMPALVTMMSIAVPDDTGTICTWRMRNEPMCGATTTEVYLVASESTRAARRMTVSTCRERVCMCWAIFWRSSPVSWPALSSLSTYSRYAL